MKAKINKKPPVIFIHGDGQNHTIWKKFEKYFSNKGHPVFSYDLPGHGLSHSYKTGEYSYFRFVEALKEIIEKQNFKKPIIVGNSTGGMIALQYATDNPESLTSVVAISSCDCSPVKDNPNIDGEEMIKNLLEKSQQLFQKQQLFKYELPIKEEAEIMITGLKYTHPEAFEGNMIAIKEYDIRNDLGKIKAPILLFRGSKDKIVTEICAKRMEQEITRAKLVTVEDFGHNVLLQAPDKILEGIKKNYSFLVQ